MIPLATPSAPATPSFESATRVAVVAALSATTMLFASLVSAYLVRRSFVDWRPASAVWPFFLLAFAFWASSAIEVASRSKGSRHRRGFMSLLLASGLYLLGALGVIVSIAASKGGLTTPYHAFVVLLLSVHVVHAILGAFFAVWIIRDSAASENSLLLARFVTHFLAALLLAIVFLLFVRQ